MSPSGVKEAPLEQTDGGFVAGGEGWFILNARDAPWFEGDYGAYTRFGEGDVRFEQVGINIEITPRVTLEGDILMDLYIESSSKQSDVNIAGTNYPSFGSRKPCGALRARSTCSSALSRWSCDQPPQRSDGPPALSRAYRGSWLWSS